MAGRVGGETHESPVRANCKWDKGKQQHAGTHARGTKTVTHAREQKHSALANKKLPVRSSRTLTPNPTAAQVEKKATQTTNSQESAGGKMPAHSLMMNEGVWLGVLVFVMEGDRVCTLHQSALKTD